MKSKTCKVCRIRFEPSRPMQSVCSPECALLVAMKKTRQEMLRKASVERQDALKQRKAMRSTREHCNDVQKLFNKAVRFRDWHEPCISCGRSAEWGGQWHASHLKSIGANSALRFNFWNVAKSCSICNNHLSGNIEGYRLGIAARYGQGRLDFLDSAPRVRKFSAEYLERLECLLRKLLNRWKRRAEACAE